MRREGKKKLEKYKYKRESGKYRHENGNKRKAKVVILLLVLLLWIHADELSCIFYFAVRVDVDYFLLMGVVFFFSDALLSAKWF